MNSFDCEFLNAPSQSSLHSPCHGERQYFTSVCKEVISPSNIQTTDLNIFA